jgi:hypothetical protein
VKWDLRLMFTSYLYLLPMAAPADSLVALAIGLATASGCTARLHDTLGVLRKPHCTGSKQGWNAQPDFGATRPAPGLIAVLYAAKDSIRCGGGSNTKPGRDRTKVSLRTGCVLPTSAYTQG